jgi:hypothetical protein
VKWFIEHEDKERKESIYSGSSFGNFEEIDYVSFTDEDDESTMYIVFRRSSAGSMPMQEFLKKIDAASAQIIRGNNRATPDNVIIKCSATKSFNLLQYNNTMGKTAC